MDEIKYFWSVWKKTSQKVSDVLSRMILIIFYFTLLMPFGIGVRLFGDPLGIKKYCGSKWVSKETTGPNLKDARMQG